MTKQEAIQKQIEEIMDNFNFARVHKMMVAVRWTWSGVGIPCEAELREEARDRLRRAAKDKAEIESGGFFIKYSEGENKDGPWVGLSLRWGESWDFEGETYEKA